MTSRTLFDDENQFQFPFLWQSMILMTRPQNLWTSLGSSASRNSTAVRYYMVVHKWRHNFFLSWLFSYAVVTSHRESTVNKMYRLKKNLEASVRRLEVGNPWFKLYKNYFQGGNSTGQTLTQRIQVRDIDKTQQFFFELRLDILSHFNRELLCSLSKCKTRELKIFHRFYFDEPFIKITLGLKSKICLKLLCLALCFEALINIKKTWYCVSKNLWKHFRSQSFQTLISLFSDFGF